MTVMSTRSARRSPAVVASRHRRSNLLLLVVPCIISLLITAAAALDAPPIDGSSPDNYKKRSEAEKTEPDPEDKSPKDDHWHCEEWGRLGYCIHNEHWEWMFENCAKTCEELVTDDVYESETCQKWAKQGECIKNSKWMYQNCGKTCTIVGKSCKNWAERGECDANPVFMSQACKYDCDRIKKQKEEHNSFLGLEEDDVYKYGTTIGYDGKPFNMETIRKRLEEASEANGQLCGVSSNDEGEEGTCGWNDNNSNNNSSSAMEGNNNSELKLPENYPAKLTLAPPKPGGPDANNELKLEYLLEKYPEFAGRIEYLRKKPTPKQGSAVACKIVNFTGRRLKKMWDDGSKEGIYNGELSGEMGGRSTLMTYDGHTFHFYDSKTNEFYRTLTMKYDVHMVVFEPKTEKERAELLDTNDNYRASKREELFMKQYYNEMGYPWLAKYGRPTPVLNSWPANYVGQTHIVETDYHYWDCDVQKGWNDKNCKPPYDLKLKLQGKDVTIKGKQSSTDTKLSLNLTVASHAGINGPKVLVIPNLMSEAECDHILRLGKQVIGDSIVGQGSESFKSNSRTSRTGWLGRERSPILDTLSRRFADVLGLDETKMVTTSLAEQLQVVQYQRSQRYDPHHDFGDDAGNTYGQRFLTLLLYIQIPEKGGHTSFPKAFGGKGMKIKPPNRGGAVLFYSMLPDGNGDDLSLHAGMPVLSGDEKWVCNLWIHDPDRNR